MTAIVETMPITNQTRSHVLTRRCYTRVSREHAPERSQPVPPLEARNSSM